MAIRILESKEDQQKFIEKFIIEDGTLIKYNGNDKEVIIPNSITSIGYGAFYNCTSLSSITIGNSVTSIGSYAFYNCTSLTSIMIPDSVTRIGRWAFVNCTKLIKVYYSGTEEQWSNIDFSYGNSNLLNAKIIFNSNRKSESIHRRLESMKLTKNSDNIEVEGHIGTWYVIDTMTTPKGEKLFLLEHEEYGDEAACVIVDENGNLIMEDVWNGFEDLEEDGYLEESIMKEFYRRDEPAIKLIHHKADMAIKYINDLFEMVSEQGLQLIDREDKYYIDGAIRAIDKIKSLT